RARGRPRLMPGRRHLLAALLLAGTACGTRAPAPATPRPVTRREPSPSPAPTPRDLADQRIADLVTEALEFDARADPPDSLYAPGASVVADGLARAGFPRLAGVQPGDRVQVAAVEVRLVGEVGFATVRYAWLSGMGGTTGEGQASLVAAPARDGGWRIVQLHSSTPRRAGP
ncbi:MAG: hypothetical protein NW201_02775, partial [Gemmatimonadales bacterium]|nr:hypothetical protein [Gemmatimonadales bacterium]